VATNVMESLLPPKPKPHLVQKDITPFLGKAEWIDIKWEYGPSNTNIGFNVRMTTNVAVRRAYWYIITNLADINTNALHRSGVRFYLTNMPDYGYFTISTTNYLLGTESEF
jgi:hypothetical protein